jgi:uncharacterized protein DUF5615
MNVRYYMDVHVPVSITEQLRRRDVDVLRAIEDDARQLSDAELLERAQELGRIVFTQDVGFRVLAEQWLREGRPFAGLLFGHQMGASTGQLVRDLELIARASAEDEWLNSIEHLPL